MRLELKLIVNFIILNFLIVPLASLLASHFTYTCLKPNTTHFILDPFKHDEKYLLKQRISIKTKSIIYFNITIPETPHNFNMYSFIVYEKNIQHYFTINYRNKFFIFLETILLFPLIKLNLYSNEQNLRKILSTVEDFDGVFEFEILNNVQFKEVRIDILECSGKVKMFIYQNEWLYKVLVWICFFIISFLVILYLTFVFYRKMNVLSKKEIETVIHNEFDK